MNFGAQIYLPFIEGLLACQFSFARPGRVFFVTLGWFGGGGYFILDVNLERIQRIEAAIEIGAQKSVKLLGGIEGYFKITAGIYYERTPSGWLLAGYLNAIGAVQLWGIAGISAEFKLGIIYGEDRSESNRTYALAKGNFKVTVKLGFLSKSTKLRFERKFWGAPIAPNNNFYSNQMSKSSQVHLRALAASNLRPEEFEDELKFDKNTWLSYATAFKSDVP